ncbi:class I SAM-dependent methyltransferase [Bernardetia sp.]|uniref:class I SAM-dependent methyltransferase n=1 Tax=Bernardetia sp. TaxID=1937974 RepID=UPI0025B94AA6|nr:class I SAM-dependent methyltransferase [Bernardetia sp.]
MNQDYYKNYYHLERNHWWFVVRLEILKQELQKIISKEKKELRILNIGIATGKTTEMLKKFGEVTSLEYDATCADFVREKLNLEVIEGSVLELPFKDNSFDMVCAFDVIEHVEDDQKAIFEMSRVCKQNGKICITVPAFQSLWSYHDEVNQHFRRYKMSEVVNLFDLQSKKNNFTCKLLRKTYFNSFLFVPIWLFRKLNFLIPKQFIRKGAGSDFEIYKENKILDSLLKGIFLVEKKLFRYDISFPFGVSLLYFVEKK